MSQTSSQDEKYGPSELTTKETDSLSLSLET